MSDQESEITTFQKWVDGPSEGLRTPEAAWLERARIAKANQAHMPTLDAALRFMRSNPLTSFEAIAEILHLGSENNAEMSGGRFRELWKLNGGAFDKKGRAWIETDLLPQILRRIIDTDMALRP